mmetsp:Transcript_47030/g.93697  ORF Transcript_47030/g.93697 Transcript_47030/m.93697 type:complete len:81 (+) Transcript_47030:198-440(+)
MVKGLHPARLPANGQDGERTQLAEGRPSAKISFVLDFSLLQISERSDFGCLALTALTSGISSKSASEASCLMALQSTTTT